MGLRRAGLALVELLVVAALVVLGTALFLSMRASPAPARAEAFLAEAEAFLRQASAEARAGRTVEVRLASGGSALEVVSPSGTLASLALPSGVDLRLDPEGTASPLLRYLPDGRVEGKRGLGFAFPSGWTVWLRPGDGGAVWREVVR